MLRLFLVLLCVQASARPADLSLRGAKGITNVWFRDVQLTQFKNRHYIFDASISPSKKHALVWHMDFRPSKIALFNLDTTEMIAHFAPGYRGEIAWTAEDRIAIVYGCGLGCAAARIFDLDGKMTFDFEPVREFLGFSENCGIVLHPSRKALAIIPSEPYARGQILLVRTANNTTARVGPPNIHCAWQTNSRGLEVRYSSDPLDEAPRESLLVELPKGWGSSASPPLRHP